LTPEPTKTITLSPTRSQPTVTSIPESAESESVETLLGRCVCCLSWFGWDITNN
jgi:hypothetical protein